MTPKDILYTAIFGDEAHNIDISRADLADADIVQVSHDTLHIIQEHKSIVVKIIKADYTNKQFVLRINDKEVSVRLRDEVEGRVHAMGFDVSRNHTKLKVVSSPMPGMVLKVLVENGSEVTEGQPVIVLEAMKMENVLNAPADGVVKEIHVGEKQNVDKGQVLIELE